MALGILASQASKFFLCAQDPARALASAETSLAQQRTLQDTPETPAHLGGASPWQRTDGAVSPTQPLPKTVSTVRMRPNVSQPLAVPGMELLITVTNFGAVLSLGGSHLWSSLKTVLVIACYLFLTLQMVPRQLFEFKSLQEIPKSHSKDDTSLYLLPFKIYTLLVPREDF